MFTLVITTSTRNDADATMALIRVLPTQVTSNDFESLSHIHSGSPQEIVYTPSRYTGNAFCFSLFFPFPIV